MEKEMKELCIEGVAIHGGPESCVGAREGVGEALAGARVGGLLSREISSSGCRRRTTRRKATSPVASREWSADPARSENPGMRGISMRENREARRPPVGADDAPSWMVRGVAYRRLSGPRGEGRWPYPEMHGRRESDSRVVPAKSANKAGKPAAEPVEERRLDEGTRASKTRAGRRAGM